jgi:hypothetical protein
VGVQYPSHLAARGSRLSALALGALLCLIVVLLVLPATAPAATRGRPLSQALTSAPPGPASPVPDTIIHGRKRLARSFGPGAGESTFAVLGGEQVHMSSTYYSEDQMQGIANVLGGLVHGQEMNSLSVYVATPEEISYICGAGALACYAPASNEMIVSGQDGSAYGVPRDYTIAHEYGHHIANNQINAPWTAIDTGAKRWATYTHVCQGVRKGDLFPGDEDVHYWDNPGEAFAETNAHLNYPTVNVPWGYSFPLRPSQGSTQRLRADILAPWTQPTTVTWNGSLWPERRNPATRRFATPLDGTVDIDLSGPAGANYDVYLLGPKLHASKRERRRARHHRHARPRPRRKVLGRAVSSGPSEHLEFQSCGQSAMWVEVRRSSGEGPFTVSVTRP